MPPTDCELAANAKRGDLVAYEQLARRHWATAYRVACAIVGDNERAQDAVQECLVQAYTALPRFDESRPFAPWLRGIAANCAHSVARTEIRAERPVPAGVGPVGDDGPDEAAAAGELGATVRAAVEQLPHQQRTAIRLFAQDELKLAEIAAVMGCAVGTVKAHLHRARSKLRALLSDYLEEHPNDEV